MSLILTIIFFVIDLVSKLVISNLMNVHDSVVVIPSVFNISYFRNTGGAWSILSNHTWLLVVVSLFVIIGIFVYVYKNKIKSRLELFGYSMILGGAIGNFFDRIIYGYVIDFLDFNIFGYNFPIFNLADTFIVIGVFLLIFSSFGVERMYSVLENVGSRLDKYLMELLDISRSKAQKLIDNGNVLVNGSVSKSSYSVKLDDLIEVISLDDEKVDILPENISLDIVYEDEYLIVVNKPSGMVVHPGNGHYSGTLVNALMFHCNNNLSKVNGSVRPGIVHRIDADTSGLLLVAKNDMVHNDLAKQISEKTVLRKYVSLVHGVINEDSATVDAPIGRDKNNRKKMCVTADNSKDAVTHLRVLERYSDATLIECKLETGRTHQIRVHMEYINHPVVNDPVYGFNKMDDKDFGQMLHAKEIGFVHPVTHELMDFQVDVPVKFKEILEIYKNK